LDLGLVSCSKSKKSHPCKASEMYSPSTLFAKSYSYAKRTYNVVGILSAKYGFLFPDEVIDPYELTLNKMKKKERLEWAKKVFSQMQERIDLTKFGRTLFHVGEKYREFLIPMLEDVGIECIIPLEGLSLGEQLAWYDQQ